MGFGDSQVALDILINAVDRTKEGTASAEGSLTKMGAAIGIAVAAAAVAVGVASVKMAADFQTSMAHLVNDAGESKTAMKMVSDGVLKLAGDIGVAPLKLADALYFIESAGYHGAQALNVLRASAIAAKVAGADMTAVADITTSALNAYGLAGSQATHVTDILMQAVAEGKMRFQDLALAMPTVLPTAAALRISLQETGAAIATMTMQGDHASDAATHLRMLMLMLVAPTSMSAKALKDLGLNADEATKHNAAAEQALAKLHITATDLSESMTTKGLLPTLRLLNDALDKTFPNANDPRREALLKTILSIKGMQAALELTGVHLQQFAANENGMADASKGAGKTMEGWADVQGQFNTKWERFTAGIQAAAIHLGTKLLPAGTAFIGYLIDKGLPTVTAFGNWFSDEALPKIEKVATDSLPTLTLAVTGFKEIINVAAPILATIIDHFNVILPLTIGITAAFVAFKAISMATAVIGLGQAFLAMAGEEGVAAAATALLGIAFGPLTLIVLAVGAVVALVAAAWINNWGDVRGKTEAVISFLRPLLEDFIGWLTPAFEMVGALIKFQIGVIVTSVEALLGPVQAVISLLEKLGVLKAQAASTTGIAGTTAHGGYGLTPIHAATGFDGVISRPTLFLAGEGGGPESVSIQPIGRQQSATGPSMDETNRQIAETNLLLRGMGQILAAQEQILQRINDDPGSVSSTSATRRFAV